MAFFDRDVDFVAEFAQRTGFSAVELCMREDMHVSAGMSNGQIKAIGERFACAGVEIAAISSYVKFTADDRATLEKNLVELCRAIEIADLLGAPYVRSLGGEVSSDEWDHHRNETIDRLAAYLRKGIDLTSGSDVTVLQSTHGSFSHGESAAAVVNRVDSERAGVLWCVVHPFEIGESLDVTWSAVKSRVKLVHVKDAVTGIIGKTWELRPLGEGDLPIEAVLRLLAQNGFRGHVSLEWEKHAKPNLADSEPVLSRGFEFLLKHTPILS